MKYTKTKSLFNPVIFRFSKIKCMKKLNLRKDSFFTNFLKTPISIIIKLDNKNYAQIIKRLKDYYQVDSIKIKIVLLLLTNLFFVIIGQLTKKFGILD